MTRSHWALSFNMRERVATCKGWNYSASDTDQNQSNLFRVCLEYIPLFTCSSEQSEPEASKRAWKSVLILIVCFCYFIKVLCRGQEVLFTAAILLQNPRFTSRDRNTCAHQWVLTQASLAVVGCGTRVIAFIRALLRHIFMRVTDDKRELNSQCSCIGIIRIWN